MHTKASIYDYLRNVLVDLFEIAPEVVNPEASLYEDLDIDSIDAVDMIVKLKELTGKKIQPADFKHVRTVQDVVDAVFALVSDEQAPALGAGEKRA